MAFKRAEKQSEIDLMFDIGEAEEPVKKEPKLSRRQKSLIRKSIVAFAALLLTVAIVLTSSYFIFTYTGYCREIHNTLATLKDADAKAFCSNMSSLCYNGSTNEKYMKERPDFLDLSIQYYKSALEEGIGEIQAITFRLVDVEKLSKDEIQKLIDSTAPEDGKSTVSASQIKKVKKVSMKIIITGTKLNPDTMEPVELTINVKNVYLVKEDGGWKVYIKSLLDLEPSSNQ